MTIISALLAGMLFGAGLVISGMTDPEVVKAFLTVNQHWNPALLGVMGAAVAVTSVGYRLANRRKTPLLDSAFHAPTNRVIDTPLVAGAILFGIGWALGGYCPGPALVGAMMLDPRALVFLAAFVAGQYAFSLYGVVKQRTMGTPVDG